MKKQYRFQFVDTEADAVAMCQRINATQSRYMTKHHPATYTPWSSSDGKEHKFVVYYYE